MSLLNQDITVDMANNDGLTPLHNAILLGRLGMASLLLEQGADIKAAALNGWSPLHSLQKGNPLCRPILPQPPRERHVPQQAPDSLRMLPARLGSLLEAFSLSEARAGEGTPSLEFGGVCNSSRSLSESLTSPKILSTRRSMLVIYHWSCPPPPQMYPFRNTRSP